MGWTNNRKTGNSFEQELCATLSLHGFWAHCLTQNRAGQPFDIIAARNHFAYPIDAKVCERDRFPLSRIEENQENAMLLWEATGNGEGFFALKLSYGSVYMFSLNTLRELRDVQRMNALTRQTIERLGLPLERWMQLCV